MPALEHFAPALGAANAGAELVVKTKSNKMAIIKDLCFIKKGYSEKFANSKIDLVMFSMRYIEKGVN